MFHHTTDFSYGTAALSPDQRVVVGTRDPGAKEDRRVAKHLGLSPQHPDLITAHKEWSDDEYLPVFATQKCLTDPRFDRYLFNYKPEGREEAQWGYGLKGKTVYIVHTFSTTYSPQDLVKRVEFIADTAKYNGAEAVVLLAYSLNYSAQERGAHRPHARMPTNASRQKFDGQGITAQMQLEHYLVAGVDAIVTPHNHCPNDIAELCAEMNELYLPMQQAAQAGRWNKRYQISFHNVDLSPMFGLFVSDYGVSNLGLDLSDKGRNVLFLGPDEGVEQYVRDLRRHSGLENSALAIMRKRRNADGRGIDHLELFSQEGIDLERGIEGMDIIVPDDAIRSGETMRNNVYVLRGGHLDNLVRDPLLKGNPRRVVTMATRTNLAGNSRLILGSPVIDDIILTNADPRALRNLNELDHKTQSIWINFVMAEAAMALERGENPSTVLTPKYIHDHQLMRVEVPHGHYRFSESDSGQGVV